MLKNVDKLEKKYDYCGACTFYLGAVIVTLLCQALAGVVSSALVRTYPNIAENGDFNTAFMICVQAFNVAFIVLFSKLNKYKFDFAFFDNGKKGGAVAPSTFVIPVIAAGLLLTGMYLPTIWYGYFTVYALHVPPEFGQINLSTTSSVVMIVIASVFLAPVCEEIIYRGTLFNGLKRERSALNAVLLSSLAFMLMHMSHAQVVFQFSLGVVSAFVMLKSGRLLPSIIMHATANSLALVIELTPLAISLEHCVAWLTANVAAAFFITVGLLAVCGAALFFLVKYGFDLPEILKRKRNGDVATDTESPCGASDVADAQTPATVKDEAVAAARRKDGTFRFWTGIVICAVLLVINLIVSVL